VTPLFQFIPGKLVVVLLDAMGLARLPGSSEGLNCSACPILAGHRTNTALLLALGSQFLVIFLSLRYPVRPGLLFF
jgi:hypothetical protein